jgi:hypothetical protein
MSHKPFLPVKVYRWTSGQKQQLFIFDESGGKSDGNRDDGAIIIKETIYQDFTVESAVNRIGLYILNHLKKEPEPFYIWTNDKSILFGIKDIKWDGYNVNPFKATDHKSDQLDEPVSYAYHNKELFNRYKTSLNIVFASDLPKDLTQNKYYFSDLKYDTYKQYKKLDGKLQHLQNFDSTAVKIASEYFTRWDYSKQLKGVVLADIFDTLHTNNSIDMIQWIDDPTRVLYKLSKKHSIKKELFTSWTNIEKVTKINVINMYSIVSKYGYCKISLDNNGLLVMNYIFDARSFTKMKAIAHHKKHIVQVLQNSLKTKLVLKDVSISAGIRLEVHNSSFKLLIKTIGEYIDIFHLIKSESNKNKMSILCAYKRSSNYNQNVDIYDYIRSRIELGLTKKELVDELNNLGIVGNIDEMIMGEMNMVSQDTQQIKEKAKVNVQEQGTIVKLETYSQGYNIFITNCPNQTELQYLIYWLSKIIATTITKEVANKKPAKQPSPVREVTPVKQASVTSSSSVDDDSVDYDNFGSFSDGDSFGGGGGPVSCLTVRDMQAAAATTPMPDMRGGAVNNNYIIDMLQETDKDLFANNYARDCQKSFQPIVISKQYKEELERKGQLHFDNVVEYGSKSNNLNYYGCPRLWCPTSKVPLPVDDPDAKCPAENEEPIQLFFDDNKNTKRFAYLKKSKYKDICVPCCRKKPPKPDEIKSCKAHLAADASVKSLGSLGVKKSVGSKGSVASVASKGSVGSPGTAKPADADAQDIDDENYIMNQAAPVPVGRYGNIPEYLHNIMYDGKVPMGNCSKVIQKAQPCFVRRGIANDKYDSIMLACSDVLGFKNKKEFVKDIRKRLDIITFMSLDDGNVVKKFMKMDGIVPSENGVLVKAYNKFRKSGLFNLGVRNSDLQLSRALNIYYAYSKYLDYIAATDMHFEKAAVHMHSLMMMLYNVTLLVWEKDGDTILLDCPQQTYAKIDFNPDIAMIMKDGQYYEPVVFKGRGTAAVNVFKLNEHPRLSEVIGNCVHRRDTVSVYQNIYAYNNWVKTKVLQNYTKYVIKTILIDNHLGISKMLTSSNILLQFDEISISFLPMLIKELGLTANDVQFYDDVSGGEKAFNISVRKDDLEVFSSKCKEFELQFNIGNIQEETDDEYYTALRLATVGVPQGLMLHRSVGKIPVKKYKYDLHRFIVKTILKKYPDLGGVVGGMERRKKIQLLLRLFENMPPKKLKKVQIILEEIPTDSGVGLKKWLSNLIIQNKYNFLGSVVNEDKKEFVFSQNAFIVNGIKMIPIKLLKYHKALPAEWLDSHIDIKDMKRGAKKKAVAVAEQGRIQDVEIVERAVKNTPASAANDMPSLFTGAHKKLGTKWVMHKKSKWINMIYISAEYSKESLPEFVNWFAKKLGLKLGYNDVVFAANKKHYEILDDKDAMMTILQDQSYFNQWQVAVKKKFPTVQMFWDNMYSGLSSEQRKKLLSGILGNIYPNDLFIMSFAKLFNVSVLLIHRGKYGQFDTTENARGDLNDLILSSTMYPAANNMGARPLLIFNKINERSFNGYYLVVDGSSPMQLYMKYSELPNNIKMLIDAHVAIK